MREPAFLSFAGRHRASAPSLILRFAPMLGLRGFSFNYLARSRILSGIGLTPLWDHRIAFGNTAMCDDMAGLLRGDGQFAPILYPAARMFPGCWYFLNIPTTNP